MGNRGEVLSVLDADAVRRWYRDTLIALQRHRRAINELNVFPVPDGDTGTNLAATMAAACAECDSSTDTDLADVTRRAARGALLAARGNSGVILAQLLQGFADTWTTETVDAAALAAGLSRATAAATEAVAEPAEGTILTVATAAAEAARRHSGDPRQGHDNDRLAETVVAVAVASRTAVLRTVDQLPALTRAGVVDAGGLGLSLMLEELVAVVTGTVNDRAVDLLERGPSRPSTGRQVARESGSMEFGYEVQYLLDTDADSIGRLRHTLSALGDSVAVVGAAATGDEQVRTWNVHVHVNEVGAAVEAGIGLGRLHRLSVTRFADQDTVSVAARVADRGVVVVSGGAGLAPIVSGEGAQPVVGPRIAVEHITGAMRATGASDVVVLVETAHRDVAEAAASAARGDGFRILLVPVQAPVQVVAALAVRDASRRFDDDVIAMAEAAAACRPAEILAATASALTSVGRCEPGDYLGLADGDVVLIDADLGAVARGLVDRLCAAGAELITVIVGAEFAETDRTGLADHVTAAWPLVEVQWLDGRQSRHLLWIGAE